MSDNNVKTQNAKKFKPNIIDFLIVIVLIGAIVGIVMRMGVIDKLTIGSRLETAQISFIVRDINDESENYFNKGDVFYSRTHKCNIGTLESVIPRLAEKYVEDAIGRLIKTTSSENRIDIIGTLIGEGVFTEQGFFLDGVNYIAPGSELLFDSNNIVGSLTITDIQPINGTK